MGTNWNESTSSVNVVQWDRSWRQEIFTDLGTDFVIKYHMERVGALESGEVIHTPLPMVTRTMSQVGSDPDVQELAMLMTKLAEKWMLEDQAAANIPVVEPPIVIPTVVPPEV